MLASERLDPGHAVAQKEAAQLLRIGVAVFSAAAEAFIEEYPRAGRLNQRREEGERQDDVLGAAHSLLYRDDDRLVALAVKAGPEQGA